MLVGRVVHDHVQHDAQASFMCGFHEGTEIIHRAEAFVDALVVGNVVAAVGQRGRKERGQPDCIDTEPLEVVEPRDQAGNVTHAVAVGVLERVDQQLIEDCVAVPTGVVGHRDEGGFILVWLVHRHIVEW